MSNIKLAESVIKKQEERFKSIAPNLSFQRELTFALQAMSNNSALANVDPKSMAKAVLSVALSGLTLNPVVGHGYIVPRKGKAVFQAGYQGLIYILIKSGLVKRVEARVVYSNDVFDLDYGTVPRVVHKPALFDRGDIAGYYAIATDLNGMTQIEFMTSSEVKQISERSDMYKSTGKLSDAWVVDQAEMGRKTVLRRLYKYLPKTIMDESAIEQLSALMNPGFEKDPPINEARVMDVPEAEYTDVTNKKQ